jgi:hypothetical protein
MGEINARLGGKLSYGIYSGYACHRNVGRINTDEKYGRPAVVATHRCNQSPDIADIEASKAAFITDMIDKATREVIAQGDTPPSAAESEALFSVSDLLGGRVVAIEAGPPPF